MTDTNEKNCYELATITIDLFESENFDEEQKVVKIVDDTYYGEYGGDVVYTMLDILKSQNSSNNSLINACKEFLNKINEGQKVEDFVAFGK